MSEFLARLKNSSIHDERLALARSLLAVSMLLTILFNDFGVIANHSYPAFPFYRAIHTEHSGFLHGINLFNLAPMGVAKVIAVCILGLTLSGYKPAISALLQVWVAYSLHGWLLIANGGDKLAYVLSLLLLPMCITDPRKNQWQPKEKGPNQRNIIANVALAVIVLQVAQVYASAAIGKLQMPEWRDGSALYYYTTSYPGGSPLWLKGMMDRLFATQGVAIGVSCGIIGFQLALAVSCLGGRKVRRTALIAGITFHLALIVFYGLITFFLVMAAALILFLDRENAIATSMKRMVTKK